MVDSVPSLTKSYSKETNNATIAKIQSLFKDSDVPNGKISVRSLYISDGEKTFSKRKDVSCTITLPIAKKDKANELKKKVAGDPDLAEIVEIECAVGKGDQFQPIEGVDRPQVGGEENLTIEHKEGEVLLVDFWATWCGPCQKPMAHNQEMLEKNEEKWKGNVRIVGASLDSDRNQLNTRITEKGWNKIDHYILPGNWKHPGPQTYGCNGIPCVVLVNKVGKIVFRGHPSEVELEEEFNRLLAEDPKKTEESPKQEEKASKEEVAATGEEKGVPAETYKKLRNLIKGGNLKSVTELNGEKGFFQVFSVLQHTKEFNADGKVIEVNRQKFMAGGAMTPAAAEILKKNLATATEGVAEEHIVKRVQVLDTVKPEFGSSCNSCSKTLTDKDAQYWSYQDKIHFCKACGDREDTTKFGVEKYVNPHALIFLHFKDPSAVGEAIEFRMKDQAQPKTKEEEESQKVHRGVGCDACRSPVNDRARFKCLNCMDIDICGVCVEKIGEGNTELPEKLKDRGHDVHTHIIQRYSFAEAR